MKIIISNGHFKFILGAAAAEANKKKILVAFITAGYPKRFWRFLIHVFGCDNFPIIQRFLGRLEYLPDGKIYSLWSSEIAMQASMILRKLLGARRHPEALSRFAMRLYGNQAKNILKNFSADIYHYRSGYGEKSVELAKQMGMHVICDHSIAHPAVLEYLVNNHGKMPDEVQFKGVSQFWLDILRDINRAKNVIVNSSFVKDTFISQGWAEERVHVVYTGVDDDFMKIIPKRMPLTSETTVKFLFAGEFGSRKGAQVLINTFEKINDVSWQLEVVGEIDRDIRGQNPSFFKDGRVKITGYLSRQKLAEKMVGSDVFIFPSLAEGSARVIFMAMACGCYVITTPNSGSIVENNIHGALAIAGDIGSLERSIRGALTMDRAKLSEIGKKNADVIMEKYTQKNYGDNLFKVYEKIMNSKS